MSRRPLSLSAVAAVTTLLGVGTPASAQPILKTAGNYSVLGGGRSALAGTVPP